MLWQRDEAGSSPFSRAGLMIDNWKDEKKCLETEKHPPKSTKYATSATNLQIGPYAISK